eukprot:Nitzschia sp. Nitz4//scaffold3_size479765//113280//113684//NITZ4_000047-RA/size479765-processed-gene-0.94-mRNA-1//-1//CDS//3329550599//4941//frame0
MRSALEDGQFLEHAEVHGNLYGTSFAAVRNIQERGNRCLMDIDVQGVRQLKKVESVDFQPFYVFIAPPSLDALVERLRGRGTESAESLERRVGNAQAELEYGLQSDNFHQVIVNDNLEDACEQFNKVVDGWLHS